MSTQQDILLESGTNELEIIEFYIDEQTADGVVPNFFGVNVAKVLEVIEAPDELVHRDSASHPSFMGTIPLREIILPVVDLSVWLNMDRARGEHESIIVTEFNRVITGFLVSGVTQIRRFSWSDVKPPNRYVSEMESNCITGTVRVDDRFSLLLDLERALSEINPGYEHAEDHIEASEEEYRLLLCDDSTSVRALLNSIFTRGGFDVTACINGEEAWTQLQELRKTAEAEGRDIGEYVNAVVSDVEMPAMDGYTLTRKIKDDPVLGKLPVILFSSIISEGVRNKGESVGADAQVTKPEFGSLASKVRELIEARRQQD